MSEAYVGEIRAFGFNFAPSGWALCQGQLLSISQYTALFSVLGTSFGGNGVSTFGLPDLRAAVPIGMGQGPSLSSYYVGETVGQSSVTLAANNLPQHNHTLNSALLSPQNAPQNVGTPAANAWIGLSGPSAAYSDTASPNTTLASSMIGITGGNQSHPNEQPYLAVNFAIALSGVFPSRS